MRPIDADALPREKMLASRGNGQYEDVDIVYGDDIDNAPTIDSLEQLMDECFNRGYRKAVRHGKWVGGDGKPKRDSFSVYCSGCGKWSEYRTKYCGECGAKMDGKE